MVIIILCSVLLLCSSPYLFVIGDDHVTRYMGVVDVVGDAGET